MAKRHFPTTSVLDNILEHAWFRMSELRTDINCLLACSDPKAFHGNMFLLKKIFEELPKLQEQLAKLPPEEEYVAGNPS